MITKMQRKCSVVAVIALLSGCASKDDANKIISIQGDEIVEIGSIKTEISGIKNNTRDIQRHVEDAALLIKNNEEHIKKEIKLMAIKADDNNKKISSLRKRIEEQNLKSEARQIEQDAKSTMLMMYMIQSIGILYQQAQTNAVLIAQQQGNSAATTQDAARQFYDGIETASKNFNANMNLISTRIDYIEKQKADSREVSYLRSLLDTAKNTYNIFAHSFINMPDSKNATLNLNGPKENLNSDRPDEVRSTTGVTR